MACYRYDRALVKIKASAMPTGIDDMEVAFDDGDLAYIRVEEIELPDGFEYEEGSDLRQGDEEDKGSFLRQPGDGKIMMGFHPAIAGDEVPDTAPILDNLPPLGVLLDAAVGSAFAGGITATSDEDAGVFDVASTTGFRAGEGCAVFRDGQAIWFGRIKAVVTGSAPTIELFPAPPDWYEHDADDTLQGGYTYVLTPAAGCADVVDVLMLGEPTDYVHTGRAVAIDGFKLSAPYRGLAKIEFPLKVALPEPPDTTVEHDGLSVQTYSYPEATQVLKGGLYLTVDGETTKLAGGAEVELTNGTEPVDGINAVDPNGVLGFAHTDRKVRITLKPQWDDAGMWETVRTNNGEAMTLTCWFGIGAAVEGFQVPAAILVQTPKRAEEKGKLHYDLVLGAGAYTGDTGTFSAAQAGNKPFMLWQCAGTVAP